MHTFHETALRQRVRQDLEATPATADRRQAYEERTESSEAEAHIAMVRLILKRPKIT